MFRKLHLNRDDGVGLSGVRYPDDIVDIDPRLFRYFFPSFTHIPIVAGNAVLSLLLEHGSHLVNCLDVLVAFHQLLEQGRWDDHWFREVH